MKLFSEKIQHLYTDAPINILRVESFEEVFLDIFEVLINDSKYLAEKVGEYCGNPVVNIPTSIGEETFIYPWVLTKGKPEVLFNENNILVIENDVSVLEPIPQEEIEENIVFEHVEKDPEVRVVFQPSRIEEYLDEAKLEELEISNELKKKKLEEQKTKIENNKRFLLEHTEKTKDELVDSFVVISEKLKEEIFDYYREYEFKADHLLSECSDKLAKELKKELKLGMTDHSTQLESKLKKFVKHIYDNIIVEKIQTDIESHINRGFNLVEQHVDAKFADIITEEHVSELLDEKIAESTKKTEEYFDGKISSLQEQSIELDAKSRKYLIDLVNESKANLISEIRKIKDEKPVEYIIESRGTQHKKNFDDISKDIDKIISSKISNEVVNLRKYVAAYSGGGTVAMQFADGGTMGGNLTVVGTISASNYAGLPGGGSDDVAVSTKVRASSADWDSTYTTVNANSATWGGGSDDVAVSTKVRASSANWDSVYNTVNNLSAVWGAPEADTLDDVTTRGNTTTNNITVSGLYTPFVQFDTTAPMKTNAEGLLQWNATDGTLDLGMDGGDITLQIGQELFAKVRNEAGYQTILNGQAVYISGRTGVYPDVRLARGDSDLTATVLGIATQDISSPGFGYVTTFGYVRGIKTDYTGVGSWGTTWATGDILYVSKTDAGVLTNVEPDTPHHSDSIGTVGVVSATQGTILVNLYRHRRLEELSDVNGTPLSANGQLIVWNNDRQVFDFDYNINNFANSSIQNLSANWENAYNTVEELSSNWNLASSKVRASSADWDSAYTSLSTKLPLSGGTLTGGLTANEGVNVAGLINLRGTVTSTNAHITYKGLPYIHSYGADSNICVGSQAGSFASVGIENTAVGSFAMRSDAIGSYNVALGTQALQTATGSSNMAIGRLALASATGDENVGVGSLTLYSTTAGYGNVGIGTGSGFSNVGGFNNTYLGTRAGLLATGSGNIVIGANCEPQSSGGSNQLNIGNAIKGDLSTGKIGLGTGTPNEILTVVGSISATVNIKASDDIEVTDFNKGVILASPDATRWRITVDNTGALTTTAL